MLAAAQRKTDTERDAEKLVVRAQQVEKTEKYKVISKLSFPSLRVRFGMQQFEEKKRGTRCTVMRSFKIGLLLPFQTFLAVLFCCKTFACHIFYRFPLLR